MLRNINSLNNYRYDELGQLTHDAQEEIENITWRNDGKIKSITRIASSPEKDITFTYDPFGNRLSKKVFDPSGDILTADYYIRDAQGNVMAVYKLNIDPQTQTTNWTVVERNIYGSDRLGVYAYPDTVYPAQGAPTTDYTSVWRGYRKYELKNHLGNVATVVTGHKIPVQEGSSIGHFTAQIEAAFDYSPFGVTRMEFGGYRYGFNGMEKDDEMKGSGNSYTTMFRQYEPSLGRWMTIDPKASLFPGQSPYAGMDNSPVVKNDPEGDCSICDQLEAFGIIFDRGLLARDLIKLDINSSGANVSGAPEYSPSSINIMAKSLMMMGAEPHLSSASETIVNSTIELSKANNMAYIRKVTVVTTASINKQNEVVQIIRTSTTESIALGIQQEGSSLTLDYEIPLVDKVRTSVTQKEVSRESTSPGFQNNLNRILTHNREAPTRNLNKAMDAMREDMIMDNIENSTLNEPEPSPSTLDR